MVVTQLDAVALLDALALHAIVVDVEVVFDVEVLEDEAPFVGDGQSDVININGTEYKLAPENAVVNDKEIIEIPFNGKQVKVYSPYADGLPF